jgi:glycosyltransferase involved in cell wall biosynthesis
MPVKVTVIVPVYNPGRHLERCVDSVLRQSLPETDYETIFVDDGSTDESPARLDALATTHPNIRVIHQENSGWPGKPRNVGIDAARGEYVFFLDHDDALGPEALERLHDFATRNGSDVVIGKMVGHGRWVPAQLFARTRDRVTLWDAPIVEYLTPHKLFRRAFLADNGLRFPEGRRRLEDHVFVLEAYFAASVISVLADPVCYHFYQRPDYGGASTGLTDPDAYYGYVREVLDIVEAHTEPGSQRDALLQRFARIQMLNRLRGPRFLGHPARYRASLFAAIQSVVEDHFAPSVDELLAPFQRTQMALVRAGRLDLVVEAAKWEQRLAVALRSASERSPSGPFDLTIEGGLGAGRQALSLERRDEGFVLDLPRDIAAVVPDAARAVAVPVSGGASVLARRRGASEGTPIPGRAERRIDERHGRYTIVDRVEATIDPVTFVSESRGRAATWDVIVRIGVAGLTQEVSVAQIQVTADNGVVLRRRPRAGEGTVVREARRLGLAGVMAVSRHMDHRLRLRLWHVAARIVRRLDD